MSMAKYGLAFLLGATLGGGSCIDCLIPEDQPSQTLEHEVCPYDHHYSRERSWYDE